MTSAMALGLRNFAESNTAIRMPLRTATALLKTVPPWVHRNPQHFHAATAALAPCTTHMCASTVTKEQKMKLFHANAASSDQSRSLSSVMSVKQTLLMMLLKNLRQVVTFILIFDPTSYNKHFSCAGHWRSLSWQICGIVLQ